MFLIDLRKNAITIIYDDGIMDGVAISSKNINHFDYYKKLYKDSYRFKNYFRKIFLRGIGHNAIDNHLVENHCIAILNWDIQGDINEDEFAELCFYLPLQYGSIEQIKEIKNILLQYPENKSMLNVYDEQLKRCKHTDREDVLVQLKMEELHFNKSIERRRVL